jgi:hypothetical protein
MKPIESCTVAILGAACLLLLCAAPAAAQSFGLAPGSASLAGATAADVLVPAVDPVAGPMPPPVVGIPAAALGIAGPGNALGSLSLGLAAGGPISGTYVFFSVDSASTGMGFPSPPAHVACEALSFEAHSDIFRSQPFGPGLALPNVLALDGDGAASVCGAPASPGLGLLEPVVNDLTNLEMCSPSFAFSGGVLTMPVYLTLAAGSPALVTLGVSTADLLVSVPPGFLPPFVAFPAAAMGLLGGAPGCAPPACDAIDALDVYGGGAGALFSLAPGSPSLGLCGYGAADVLLNGPGPCGALVVMPSVALGLLPTDNVDALTFNFDGDGDLIVDP